MNTRLLALILAIVLIAPESVPASNMPALTLPGAFAGLSALAGPQAASKQQCVPARRPLQVADDETVVVPDACDAAAQAQCTSDCQLLRTDCETGHDDSLPCEANYITCQSNCSVMAGCSN